MTLSLLSRFDRSPKRVFYLTGHQLTAYHWRDGALADAYLFRAGEEGLADFSRYLDETPGMSTYFLVDVIEEEFRRDTVPHVFGKDRRELISHRSKRLFRDTAYFHAVPQGREPEGRKDDRILYVALTSPALLETWLEVMQRQQVPLAGIYSLPLFSERLLPRLEADSGATLLVTLQSAGNLRQSFFIDGQLKISRLAHLPVLEGQELAESILDEIEKLRRYLSSLRLLLRESPLDVYILSHGATFTALERTLTSGTLMTHHLVDVADVAGELKMSPDFVSLYTDGLFSHLLLKSPPPNHYATSRDTRHYRLHRARGGILAASVVLMLASVLWGGILAVEGLIFEQRAAAAAEQADYYQHRYNQARERLPPTPATPQDLKLAVQGAEELAQHRDKPLALLSRISLGLSGYPDLFVEQIEWQVQTDVDLPPGALPGSEPGLPPSLARDSAGQAVYHTANISGRVLPFDGNYRNALEMVRGFAQKLRALEGVLQVKVVSLPLNVSPNESLSGDVGVTVSQDKATWELRLIYKKPETSPDGQV